MIGGVRGATTYGASVEQRSWRSSRGLSTTRFTHAISRRISPLVATVAG
jgi:hypothetical protein